MGLHDHHSDRAAVCRVVPFRLWASRGDPPKQGLVGASWAGKARTGTALAPGAGELRQSSRNPTAIKPGQKSPRKANKRRAPVLLVSAEELPLVSGRWRPGGGPLIACGGGNVREYFRGERRR